MTVSDQNRSGAVAGRLRSYTVHGSRLEKDMTPLLDTHQHLLYRDTLGYAWSDDLLPLANRDFTLDDYRELTDGKEVAASIFMEAAADDYRAEARFVSKLAQDANNRIAGMIASCRPEEDDGFDAWLDECADMPVVGYRRILHEVPDGMSQTDAFRRNIRKTGARGKVFDMVFRADQLTIARELAMACDDMILVLDHCGVPDIAGGDFDAWRGGITALAEVPHVACKLSGVLAYCAPGQATRETIQPYIDHVIDSFGPARLVWGSDWPVVDLGADLPGWIDIFREMIAPLSDDEKTAICNGNARRIYGVSV